MKKLAAGLIVIMLIAAGCSSKTANEKDAQASRQALSSLQDSQPVPQFNWSQLRQTLIDIEGAQAQTTQTTTFFFNMGVPDPISSCPSIGFPIATTTQLTNPLQAVGEGAVVEQVDPTGVYTGVSTGTYVLCVDANGKAYAFYWEGFVATLAGPARWDATTKQAVLIGAPSAEFANGQK